ncbi:MAG: hypothetical protein GWN01_05225 [Nitrosopumilaceae archaeon]|nr:hypothetical protein [Nitrosopumilaceae archaeon]NIU00345.1 hypothetical protein [Nitrosopumilaceae archaeon]NIU86747.1 hypothetical protein [Nitrosopumilaceae archaeon]NIV65447.1 hypothetical protein [Nitrosopumilaceae archaeon]NIX60947.1 hypothetical protein [Nitrosopumilaceae archaeon]
MSSYPKRERSVFWYVLPAVFSIFGGIAAYYLLKNDDPEKAKRCLWLGIILAASYIGYFLVFSLMIQTFEFS